MSRSKKVEIGKRQTFILALPRQPVTLQCAWLITNSKNMHGLGLAFHITCTSECDLNGCFFLCSWSMLLLWSCCQNTTLVYSNSALANGSILHCLWIQFDLQSMMYMDGVRGCIVVRNCQCREEKSLSTADSDFTDVQSLAFASCLFSPPHSSYFQPFIFLHKGKMRKNKTNIWKLKHDREGRGRGGRTEEGEAISENKRAFKSKGWKLVRLLFLKNDSCVVLLLRARYILFYLPEEWGVFGTKKPSAIYCL